MLLKLAVYSHRDRTNVKEFNLLYIADLVCEKLVSASIMRGTVG